MSTTLTLVCSGDLRPAANAATWPAQAALVRDFAAVAAELGVDSHRAFPVDDVLGHGFITSQKMGMHVFRAIDPDAPLVVLVAGWQYTHHVLAGLISHRGPILTVGNWSGQFPGLVGLLNLNGSLIKAGVRFSTIWSLDFSDDFFRQGLQSWLDTGTIDHDLGHVHDVPALPTEPASLGARLGVAWACSTPSCPTTCCILPASSRNV